PLPIPAHRIKLARKHKFHGAGSSAQESLERWEGHNAAALAGGVLIEVNPLTLETETHAMTAASQECGVAQRNIIQPVEAWEPVVAARLRDNAADRKVAELFTRDPGHRRRYVDRTHVIGEGCRAIDSKANLVQQSR